MSRSTKIIMTLQICLIFLIIVQSVVFITVFKHKHQYQTFYNEKEHYSECQFCGKIIDQGKHNYVDVIDDIVSYYHIECENCSYKSENKYLIGSNDSDFEMEYHTYDYNQFMEKFNELKEGRQNFLFINPNHFSNEYNNSISFSIERTNYDQMAIVMKFKGYEKSLGNFDGTFDDDLIYGGHRYSYEIEMHSYENEYSEQIPLNYSFCKLNAEKYGDGKKVLYIRQGNTIIAYLIIFTFQDIGIDYYKNIIEIKKEIINAI